MNMELRKIVGVLFVLYTCVRGGDEFEPKVAFLCEWPSMYLTDHGWVKDDSVGCLKDPVDILNYCRKVFPKSDIRNVVEANNEVKVDNWCSFGQTSCQHSVTVRPFRCLVGPFQSDALLVPDKCVFDHVHDQAQCTSYGAWNETAERSCRQRAMQLHSFSMLQPCGVDRFNGVEFVCCPQSTPVSSVDSSEVRVPADVSTDPANDDDDDADEDVFRTYMSDSGAKWSEHEKFQKAMDDLRRNHDDKISKMMKELSVARQHLQDLKATNPRRADKLDKDVTSRFQKTYEALEVESEQEKRQLRVLHQQRVQSHLNEKTRAALTEYMQAINDNDNSWQIMHSLKHYIKTLQKDRLHTINHYRHLRDTDPAEADKLRSEMAVHIRKIDDQLSAALALLDRVPAYKKKVQLQIADYIAAYHADDANAEIITRNLDDYQKMPTLDTDDDRRDNDDEEDDDEDDWSDENDDDDDEDYDDDDDADDVSEEVEDESVLDTELDRMLAANADDSDSSDSDSESEESDEKQSEPAHAIDDVDFMESGNIELAHGPFAAHVDESHLSMQEPLAKLLPEKGMNSFSGALPVGLVIGSLTVLIIILIGIVVVRRRNHFRRTRAAAVKVRVDPAASPEERHIASMQMTGYENPTYKYFESNGASNA